VREGDNVPVPNGEQIPQCDERLGRKRVEVRMAFVASAVIRLSVCCTKSDGDGQNMMGNVDGEPMLSNPRLFVGR
jgi:hypothetical protein